jgi:site-specific DNA-methyltransferase (adenine-specific)
MKKEAIWKNRIVEHGTAPANEFLAHELNARRHPGHQRDSLRGSLNEVGWVAPVIVSAKTGKLLDGHARIEEALTRDENTEVPFIKVDVSEGEERLILASFDPITNQAYYDKEVLDALLREVSTGDSALTQLLADLAESNGLYNEPVVAPGDGGDEFDESAVDIETRCQPGDLWTISSNGLVHYLLCGDSTKLADVQRAMQGQAANLLLTDPPYNVAYTGKTKNALTIDNDSMNDEDFRRFLQTAFLNAFEVMEPGASFYIWHADSEGYNFRGAIFDCGEVVRQCLIWVKDVFVLGRQDYHWQHEPCLYGWKAGAAHQWLSDRKQTTLLNFDRPKRNAEHPTMKPVALFEYQIKNSAPIKSVVLDLFGGSGTTLIAAHRTGRASVLLELDPKYCDVILSRAEAEGLSVEKHQ